MNLVIKAENLYAMSKYPEYSIDFMLWDPPYNTGTTRFMYKDKYKDTWLSFMEVRLELAKKLLKESGVIAVHIGYQELFRLGLLMDEVFGKNNRLGIVNWECAYSTKNNSKGIPSTTDYVLVYAKDKAKAFRGTLPRTAKMDSRYKSPDGDSRLWSSGDLSAASGSKDYFYGIENPITGETHYPPQGRYWRLSNSKVKQSLSDWGVEYIISPRGNCVVKSGQDRNKAEEKFKQGPWPRVFFLGREGKGRPRLKRYKDELRNKGRIVGTYWKSDEVSEDSQRFSESLTHDISGHNGGAKKLIKSILGDRLIFDTPKPIKLTERLVQIFCPKDGIVMDAFGGSGTTGHAVLNLNYKYKDSERTFILIENGDFIKDITVRRIENVITGNWAKPKKDTVPLGGEFKYLDWSKPEKEKYKGR